MAELARFDTGDMDATHRLAGWARFIGGTSGRLNTRSCGTAPFSGSIKTARLGVLKIMHIIASPHCLEQPAGNRSGHDMLRIVIQVRGQAVLSQGGRDILLEPGCWTAWSTDRSHLITNLTDVEQYALLMPLASVGIRLEDVLRQAGTRLGDRPGAGRLLPDHIARLFENADAIGPSQLSEMSDIVAHLIRLALTEDRDAEPRSSMRDTMRNRVADFVRHNLRNPDMSLAQVARHFGCSKRNIHKIFSDRGVTLSQFLWAERLDRCRESLASPQLAGRSITQIAFEWGFNNSTHFSKAFKARFGVAPGAWRAEALTIESRAPSNTPH